MKVVFVTAKYIQSMAWREYNTMYHKLACIREFDLQEAADWLQQRGMTLNISNARQKHRGNHYIVTTLWAEFTPEELMEFRLTCAIGT